MDPTHMAYCDSRRAAEVTLQPIRRYGIDRAIIFPDTFVVPWALGQQPEIRGSDGQSCLG